MKYEEKKTFAPKNAREMKRFLNNRFLELKRIQFTGDKLGVTAMSVIFMQNLSSQSLARSASTGCDVHVPRLCKRPESITICSSRSIGPSISTAAHGNWKQNSSFIFINERIANLRQCMNALLVFGIKSRHGKSHTQRYLRNREVKCQLTKGFRTAFVYTL